MVLNKEQLDPFIGDAISVGVISGERRGEEVESTKQTAPSSEFADHHRMLVLHCLCIP